LKKNDIILILVFTLMAGALYFTYNINKEDGDAMVVVTVDGEEYGKYPLNENQTVKISEDQQNFNILKIENGKAKIESANCHNQNCVKAQKISSEGQMIACLPHKMLVTIVSKRKSDLDAVS